jgi:chromosome segregation ATPase
MTALSKFSWCGAVVLAMCFAAAVMAQGRGDVNDANSMAAVTSELRQLRVAVEESTRSQTQTQALGVYLSVQQSRILQVAARLDSVRKELDTATMRSRGIASELSRIDDDLPRTTDPGQRSALESAQRALKPELEQVKMQEQQARLREGELSQALQLEDSRWTDLISRLEQLIKR